MNTRITLFAKVLLMSLALFMPLSSTQATDTKPGKSGDAPTETQSFATGMYMGANKKLLLMLDIRQPKWVTVTLKDAKNSILHRTYLKRSPKTYRMKFNFEESDPGLYRIEISDGQQTVVRQVKVVDFPTVESYRYVTINQ
ncbi:hypothetical protein ACO2Q8_14635 [Larkinella sp. VNQ87]|uniref:hypothetical protein n=1 Tax=Larkinella sp. VNQ87 TaxID=3400921 RepID=UPI003C06A1FC